MSPQPADLVQHVPDAPADPAGDAQWAATARQSLAHADARLCDGFLEGHEIECPYHQGRFDIRNGAATLEPCVEAIRSYPVKVDGGRVWVEIAGFFDSCSRLLYIDFRSFCI